MKTRDRVSAVDASRLRMQAGVPELPLQDVQLMRLIRIASLGISACVEPLLRGEGLSESALETLVIVVTAEGAGCTPGELCEQVGQTRANMTRLIDLLLKQGLIAVATHRSDRRRKTIAATAAGRRMAQKCAARMGPSLSAAMSGLNKTEKQQFEALLRKLAVSMDLVERQLMLGGG